MDFLRPLRGRVSAVGVRLTALAAVLGQLSGCVNDFAMNAAPPDNQSAAKLLAGSTTEQLTPGVITEYDIEVPEGQGLDLFAVVPPGADLDLTRVIAPDGESFWGSEFKTAAAKKRFGVSSVQSRSGGKGVHFATGGNASGVWRLTFLGTQAEALDSLRNAIPKNTFIEGLLLGVYLLDRGPDGEGTGWMQRLAQQSYPELARAERPLSVAFEIVLTGANDQRPETPTVDVSKPADDSPDTGDTNTGGDTGSDSDNGNSGGDTNDGSDGGADGNTDNGGSGDNTDGTDGTDTTTQPPPLVRQFLVAQSGDSVPDQPTNTKFVAFGNPVVDAEGRIAFWAKYSGGHGDDGLFMFDGSELRTVITDDPQNIGIVPGGAANAYFGDVNVQFDSGAPALAWGAGGRLLFVAPVSRSPYPVGAYRWRATDGDLIRVADISQMAPLFTDAYATTFSCEFFNPCVSDAGLATFAVRYTYIDQSRSFVTGRTGVFTSNGTVIKPVADNRLSQAGEVPDQASTAVFDTFESRTAMNGRGDILFQATYRNGTGNRGVYLYSGGQLVRVLDNGQNRSFPGVPLGARVNASNQAFKAISLGANGQIAVDTTLTVNNQVRDAVLLWDGQRWRELTGLAGAPSSALLSGVNSKGQVLYMSGGKPYLARSNGNLDLSLLVPPELLGVPVRWESSGGALNDNGRAMLRYTRLDADGNPTTPGLLFYNGEKMLLMADPAASTPSQQYDQFLGVLKPESDRVGRSGALNGKDRGVYRAATFGADGVPNTADDRQAIYLSDAVFPRAADE